MWEVKMNKSLSQVGGACAILLGLSYIVVAIAYLVLPSGQGVLWLSKPADFLQSFNQKPAALVVEYLAFIVGAVFAFGAIPAIEAHVSSGAAGWIHWASNLAYLSFAVVVLNFFRLLVLLPSTASSYVAGDPTTQQTIIQNFNKLSLDPQGWIAFGGAALWVLVVSLEGTREGRLPGLLVLDGIAVAVLYAFVIAGILFNVTGLVDIAAVLGGIILGPIWYIWFGVRLFEMRFVGTRMQQPAQHTA
jgi:hypothetical protein